MEKIKGIKIDTFTRQYLETALWSSTDNSRDDGGDPLDKNYSIEDIERKSLMSMVRDCRDFQEIHKDLLTEVYTIPDCNRESGAPAGAGHDRKCASNRRAYDASDAGHDFWLTRNGHGAGFWDRGLGAIGDKLTEASKPYGSVDLYVHRGRIYC